MVYDWEGKRDICYKMYIEDKMALEDIMQHMKAHYEFQPSKRAFQTQFKRWGFPSKHRPAHKDAGLVGRVKELWERNTMQRDMLQILNAEGYEIKERELMRLRAKNRWLLRVPNGMKPYQEKAQADAMEGAAPDVAADEAQQHAATYGAAPDTSVDAESRARAVLQRQQRRAQLQAESDERWATKKRRRRTRGWAGLPADPPGPPRFPSETTLEESKGFLSLDEETYKQIRDQFQQICEEAGFFKKTIAGPERWQAAKDRLIRENAHLQTLFWENSPQLEYRTLALDVVCTDVTKRMRTQENRMTIAEAKNVLGINPEQGRMIRNTFYEALEAASFTSKLEMGNDRWKELKQNWIQSSELLQSILAPGPTDPLHAKKIKATEVLCRDVMKRLRDDQAKRDPSKRRYQNPQQTRANESSRAGESSSFPSGASTLASQALASSRMAVTDMSSIQIDPSLVQNAAVDPSFGLAHHPTPVQPYAFTNPAIHNPSASMPVPVFLRVHPQSQVHQHSKTWIGKLNSRTLAELRMLVLQKFGDVRISRIEGAVKDDSGRDISFLINEDHELDAYLSHVEGRTATFLFFLQPAM